MHLYQFQWSDGYYSILLKHDKEFTNDELIEMYDEAPHNAPQWLIDNKGFKPVNYTLVSMDCGSITRKDGE